MKAGRFLILFLIALSIALSLDSYDFGLVQNAGAAVTRKTTQRKRTNKSRTSYNPIKVLMKDTATGEWVHRGRKNIIIHKDTSGRVRAMAAFSMTPVAGKEYADAINAYAKALKGESVKVWSLVVPSQGEFYMPEMVTNNLSQRNVIEKVAELFDDDVSPIFISDTLRNHMHEKIYLHSDHHWSGLGAYYGASAVASLAGLPFMPIYEYATDTIKNFVGTMRRLSGDPEIQKHPEDFIYYIPGGDYTANFIDYTRTQKKGFSSSKPHNAPIFRKFPDGSGAAYSTYLGGDNHTVKIINKNGNTGRKICIIKDSYGNALAPCLINSFDEVHVLDFRYYHKNPIKYIKENNITDLIFVNCVELAFTNTTASKLNALRRL